MTNDVENSKHTSTENSNNSQMTNGMPINDTSVKAENLDNGKQELVNNKEKKGKDILNAVPADKNKKIKKKPVREPSEGGSKKFLWLLAILALGGIALGYGFMNKDKFNLPDDKEKTSSEDPENTAKVEIKERPVNQPERIKLGQVTFIRPPEGNGNVLTEKQIGWCLYQKTRIDTLRTEIREDVSFDQLNKETDAYNSRCGNYRYSQGSFSVAQSDLEPNQEKIVADAIAEAKVMDEFARTLPVQEQAESAKNPTDNPLLTDAPKVSLPETASPKLDDILFPADECALVTKMTSSYTDAQNYIKNEAKGSKYARIYQLKGGDYAVSIGTLKPNQMGQLTRWKKDKKVPEGSACFHATAFKGSGSDVKPIHKGIIKQPSSKLAAPQASPNSDNKLIKPSNQTPRPRPQLTQPSEPNTEYQYSQPMERVQPRRQSQSYQRPSYNSSDNYNSSNSYNSQSNFNDNSYNPNNNTPIQTPATSGLETGTFSAGDESGGYDKNQREIDNLFEEHGSTYEKRQQKQIRRESNAGNVTTITNVDNNTKNDAGLNEQTNFDAYERYKPEQNSNSESSNRSISLSELADKEDSQDSEKPKQNSFSNADIYGTDKPTVRDEIEPVVSTSSDSESLDSNAPDSGNSKQVDGSLFQELPAKSESAPEVEISQKPSVDATPLPQESIPKPEVQEEVPTEQPQVEITPLPESESVAEY